MTKYIDLSQSSAYQCGGETSFHTTSVAFNAIHQEETMIAPASLADSFDRNVQIIKLQADGLSQAAGMDDKII